MQVVDVDMSTGTPLVVEHVLVVAIYIGMVLLRGLWRVGPVAIAVKAISRLDEPMLEVILCRLLVVDLHLGKEVVYLLCGVRWLMAQRA